MATKYAKRTIPLIDDALPVELTSASPFVYSPLDQSVDSIRLLILEPAQDTNALICCRLQHVTFTQKPKYEALSYSWGNENVRCNLSINGKDLEVGQNLFDALGHLRDPLKARTLWVDAICINQSDTPEKNHQIGIMPLIYMRAKTVLVWLGVPEDGTDQLWNWEQTFEKSGNLFIEDANLILLRTLCDNPYWKRVWIIQEVGHARKLLVQYGSYKADWTAFITRIQSNYKFQDSLPVKLQKQLDEKFENGHKLQALIESHRGSLCKEPRDHVYGFVGLAIDSQEGYPIDYGKSLYDVWKDVILFKNADQPAEAYADPAIDTLHFGRIVQGLLGGPEIVTASEVARDISPPLEGLRDSNSKLERDKIRIPARISGKIVHLGPTYQEIMSNLKAMASWRASITRYLPEGQQPLAREESELFLEILEDTEEGDLDIVLSFEKEIAYPKSVTPSCIRIVDQDCRPISKLADIDKAKTGNSKPVSKDPRLFLLDGVRDYSDNSPGKLGLAPANATVGDYVFLIHGIEKAVVVRKEEDRVRLIGTAAHAENRYVARAAKNGALKREKRFGTADLKSIHSRDRLDLFVDVATAYQLMN